MPSNEKEKESSKLPPAPSSADFTQTYNRIAASLSNRQLKFQSFLSKHRKPTTTNDGSSTDTSGVSTPFSTTKQGAFTSLSAKPSASSSRFSSATPALITAQSNNSSSSAATPMPNIDTDNDPDLDPNKGLGYAPPPKNGALSAAEKTKAELRRKVLGKKQARELEKREREAARKGPTAAVGVKRPGDEESEDDEESVGKGALVRGRKKVRVAEELGVLMGRGRGRENQGKKSEEKTDGESQGKVEESKAAEEPGKGAERQGEKQVDGDIVTDEAETRAPGQGEGQTNGEGKKTKKKKNKKKKKKKNETSGEQRAGEKGGAEKAGSESESES